MTVLWTVRATEPTAVFSPQRKYKTVGSSPSSATNEKQTSLGMSVFYLMERILIPISVRVMSPKGEGDVGICPCLRNSNLSFEGLFTVIIKVFRRGNSDKFFKFGRKIFIISITRHQGDFF